MLAVKQDLLIDYINQATEEFIQNELKAHEILQKGEYFVSDIVNYNVFTERPGERIIMTSNTNLNKILSEIFGKEIYHGLVRDEVKSNPCKITSSLI
jgi:hypothetical protein